MDVFTLANRQRRDQNKRDDVLLQLLMAHYGVWSRGVRDLLPTLHRDPRAADALRLRWTQLTSDIVTRIIAAQQSALTVAQRDAVDVLRAADPAAMITALSIAPVTPGRQRDGTLVQQALLELGELAVSSLLTLLRTATPPAAMRRSARGILGGYLQSILRTARESHMFVYRTVVYQSYRSQLPGLVRGWQWVAAHDRRTCALCLALDGREFPLDTPFFSHVCCRCSMVPILSNAPAYPERETGAQWLERQDPAVQRQILGIGKWELWHAGRITLDMLIQETHDPRWGAGRKETPLYALK